MSKAALWAAGTILAVVGTSQAQTPAGPPYAVFLPPTTESSSSQEPPRVAPSPTRSPTPSGGYSAGIADAPVPSPLSTWFSEPFDGDVFGRNRLTGVPRGAGVPRLWGGFEYLLWWFKDTPLPVPLVTTGSRANPVPAALGQSKTKVLLGGESYGTPIHSGYRLTLGGWLDNDARIGVEGAGLFFQPQNHVLFSGNSGTKGLPILGIPFLNVTPPGAHPKAGGWQGTGPPGAENALLAANGTTRFGTISATTTSQLWGVEGNAVFSVLRTGSLQIAALAGFRTVSLLESVNLDFASDNTGAAANQLLRLVTISDHFATRNQFYGPQVGVRGVWSSGWVYCMLQGKLAMGDMNELLIINGQFADSLPKLYNEFGNGPGGIFAQPSNIGRHHLDRFAVLPAVDARIGVNLLPTLRLYVGYEFLYMSNVGRPGEQIDRAINTTQVGPGPGGILPTLSGPARPTPQLATTDFWAQGINFGLLFTY